jgi:hypothetical protein
MKLKNIRPLHESEDKTYSFTTTWDGQTSDDFQVSPFDVRVTYYADPNGHPAGGHLVQITSVVTDQPVKVESDKGLDLEKLKDIHGVHAIVIGSHGGTMTKLQSVFKNAAVFNLEQSKTGAEGAMDVFHFLDDHKDDDVIVNLEGSSILKTDPTLINLFKAVLDGREVNWKSEMVDHSFKFGGRIVFYISKNSPDYHSKFISDFVDDDQKLISDFVDDRHASEAHHHAKKVHRTIYDRTVIVDLSNDQVFPRGTRVQDIPGWDQSMMQHFEELAEKDFTGHD